MSEDRHEAEAPERLSTQAVCNQLDISKRTLQNWEKSGVIPRIRRDWRGYRIFTQDDVDMIRKVISEKARRNRPES